MKSYILLLYIINLTLVLCLGDSDCEHLSSFFKKYGHDMKEDCCNEPGIECENNYIKSIDLTLKPGKIDFSDFPNIENLEKLSIKGDVFGGILPLNKLHNAKILDFSHSSIKEVKVGNDKESFLFDKIEELNLSDNLLETFPYEINSYSLESLILDNNKITGPIDSNNKISKKISLKNNNYTGEFIVPYNVQSLNIENNFISSIKMENLKSNELKELIASNNKFDDDVFRQLEKFENLEKLILSENKNISNVTEHIGKLSELEYLDLSKNNIKDLHSNLFILTELKDFNISENPNLNAKIINFAGFEAIRNCNFNNTSISCYQPNTCSNIFNDYKICSDEEINSIKSSQTLKPKSFLRSLIKIIVAFITFIIFVVICFIVVCCCCLKKCCFGHSKKNKKNKKIIHSSPMYSDNSKMDNNNNNYNNNNNNNNNYNNNNNNYNNNNNNNNNYNNNNNNVNNANNNNNNNLSQNPNVTMPYPSIIITNSTPTAPTIEVVPNSSYSENSEPSSNANYNNSYSYSYNYNKSFNNNNINNNNNNINENNNNTINNDGLPTYEEATSHLK